MGVLYNNTTPAGVVHMFMGVSAPEGYLMCDGTAYLRASYPQLFAALGTAYDTQINAATGTAYTTPGATFFRIPDCRGAFLRVANNLGTAAGAGVRDPNFGTRVGGQATSRIGSTQGDATAVKGLANTGVGEHFHAIQYTAGVGSGAGDRRPHGAADANLNTLGAGAHSHSMTGDEETRPINMAVGAIIKT